MPDVDVLEFFRSTAFHTLASGSQQSYALDLRLFLTFLSGQGVDWRAATESDLEDFEHWRRRDGGNPRRISSSKFSRELAAIGKFYAWQQRRGVVRSSPVAMRERELPLRRKRCGASAAPEGCAVGSAEVVDAQGLSPMARCWPRRLLG